MESLMDRMDFRLSPMGGKATGAGTALLAG